jgi:hypothetical protein
MHLRRLSTIIPVRRCLKVGDNIIILKRRGGLYGGGILGLREGNKFKIKCKYFYRIELYGNRVREFINTSSSDRAYYLSSVAITQLSKKTLHHKVRLY